MPVALEPEQKPNEEISVSLGLPNEHTIQLNVVIKHAGTDDEIIGIDTFSKVPTEKTSYEKVIIWLEFFNKRRIKDGKPEMAYEPAKLRLILNMERARITQELDEITKKRKEYSKRKNKQENNGQQQEQQEPIVDEPEQSSGINDYIVEKDCVYKIQVKKDDIIKEFLCNFWFDFKRDAYLDDGITVVRRYEGICHCNGKKFDFKTDATTFTDDRSFEKFFGELLGSNKRYNPFSVRDIRSASINLMSPTVESITVRKVFGFAGDKYLTPSVIIDKDGIRPNTETPVDLSEIEGAKCLDMEIISDEDFRLCGEHERDDFMSLHDPYYMRNLMGYGYISPVMSKIEDHPKAESFRYIPWAVAKYSIGKSFAAKRMQNHFGHFKDKDILAFDSTPYTAGIRGYYFKDAFFLWDNFRKDLMKNRNTKTQYEGVINNYADGNARGRLGEKLVEQRSKYIRGTLFVTGEDIPQDKGGVVSRIRKIPVEPKTDRIKGKRCLDMQHLYPGFMAMYTCWVIKTKPIDSIVDRLLEYSQDIITGIENEPTADRISKSAAIPLTGYTLFLEFMVFHKFITEEWKEKELAEFKNQLMDMRTIALENVVEAGDTQIFIQAVQNILNSKRATTDENNITNKTSIGFFKVIDGEELFCIRHDVIYAEVQKYLKEQDDRSISVGIKQLMKMLKDEGLIVKTTDNRNAFQTQNPISGNYERVMVMKKETFGLNESSMKSLDMEMIAMMTVPGVVNGNITIVKKVKKEVEEVKEVSHAQINRMIKQLSNVHIPNSSKETKRNFSSNIKPLILAYLTGKCVKIEPKGNDTETEDFEIEPDLPQN